MIVATLIALALIVQSPGAPSTHRGRANLASYFSTDDYPPAALHAGEEGTVQFRLTISPEGRASDCAVVGSSGSAILDEATCRILRERARYSPARDAEGRPVTGTDHGSVTWRLPPPEPQPDSIPAENCAGCTRPSGTVGSFFRVADYPSAALRTREQGRVGFRVLIGTDGRVKRCQVTASSGSQSLDVTTCAILLARARYQPARDPNGAPVEGVDNGSVTWWMPGS